MCERTYVLALKFAPIFSVGGFVKKAKEVVGKVANAAASNPIALIANLSVIRPWEEYDLESERS